MIQVLVVRGNQGIAILRTQYRQASEESSSTFDSLRHRRKKEALSGLLLHATRLWRLSIGRDAAEAWKEMVGLADRRGKFPDYLSFTVKQTRFQSNAGDAWNNFCSDR